MNFTKPGLTGGRGYKGSEHSMRIMYRSKKDNILKNSFENWESLTNLEEGGCEYIKTSVLRRKQDVLAAAADSDQEELMEQAMNLDQRGEPTKNQPKERAKKRKAFYYYALRFKYTF